MKNSDKFRTQSLSNRQFSFLAEAIEANGLSLERMLEISQTTAGSVVRRGFFAWNRDVGRFELTAEGYEVMERFQHSEIGRQAQYLPFSRFIHNRELEQLTRDRREQLKQEFDARKKLEKSKQSGVDRVKEARVKMKTKPKRKGE
jgi:hypothetical protein